MNYEERLYANMDRILAEMLGIHEFYLRLARDTKEFIGRYEEKRTNPRRANRLPSWEEHKAIARGELEMDNDTVTLGADTDFDPTVLYGSETMDLNNDLSRTPAEDLSLGRYERSLLEVLGRLRGDLKTFEYRYRNYEGPGARENNLNSLRVTLDRIRVAQRQLNATGHYKFLLV